MSKQKSIDWLINPDRTPGITRNYVFGCLGKCKYCYARPMAKRFGIAVRMAKKEMECIAGKEWFLESKWLPVYITYRHQFLRFIPTFRPSVLAQKLPEKPTMIFFSMSDPVYWESEWYEKILKKICQHMQHTFVILTKSPMIYEKYTFPHNCWLGVTICTYHDYNCNAVAIDLIQKCKNKIFISFEPIHNTFSIRFLEMMLEKFDWVIVGPETGIRTNKIIPPPEWIEPFFDLPGRVFMKSACSKIIDRPLRQEWPEGYLND